MIKVTDGDDQASAYVSTDGDGWVVKVTDRFSKQRRFYPYTGGAWLLKDNGEMDRQIRGIKDERAPRSAAKMRAFLKKFVLGTV